MSGRCRACNERLSPNDMVKKVKSNVSRAISYSDLCSVCMGPPPDPDLINLITPTVEEYNEE